MMTANTDSLRSFWLALPKELCAKLLLGFTGKRHLLDIAGWCLRAGESALHPVAADAVLAAFGENPLDGEMAGELVKHDAIRAILPQAAFDSLSAVAQAWQKPANTGYFERLLGQRDIPKLKNFLASTIERDPANLFWRQQAVAFGLIDNDPDWVRTVLDFAASPALAPVIDNVLARIHELKGEHDEAAAIYTQLEDVFGASFASLRAGLNSPATKANRLLLEALVNSPWNANLILRIHDQVMGVGSDKRPLDGTVAILLYSWNKDEELDETLRSLSESPLSNASIFVLDNGSTDSTPDVLTRWQEKFDALLGEGRFEVITLPVNIGAPAARNWLMHHPSVGEHDFICYLDDDVVLPPDWLGQLGSAVHHYPDAGVWGCKVVDHANPALIQSADSHLLVDEDGPALDLTRPAPNPFKLSDLHIQSLDAGLFDIMRPCASVIGCCHLFRTERLKECGDFAIHLSPSQYDDMEHDIRLCEAGLFPVYQGHLVIRHKKSTGAASHVSMQEEGSALGNKYKMQTMHERESLLEAMRAEQELLEDDLLRKIEAIETA